LVSIYGGSGRVRNVIFGHGRVQNNTRVLILGHGGEGIGGRNVGFDSLKSKLNRNFRLMWKDQTSENPTQSFIHNIILRRKQNLAIILYIILL
jgi:hypothetical protein